MTRTLLARSILAATLFLTLAGPAPGAVGSCTDAGQPCDAAHDSCDNMFCEAQLHAICDRNRRVGGAGPGFEMHPECAPIPLSTDTTMASTQLAAETAAITRTCGSTPHPFGSCAPSDLGAQSCIDGLSTPDSDDIAPNCVTECFAVLCCAPGSCSTCR